jgi:hypothetical protein
MKLLTRPMSSIRDLRGVPEPAGNLEVASEKAPLLGLFPEKNL